MVKQTCNEKKNIYIYKHLELASYKNDVYLLKSYNKKQIFNSDFATKVG